MVGSGDGVGVTLVGVGSGSGRVGVGCAFVGEDAPGLGFFPPFPPSPSLPGFDGTADALSPADGDADPDADSLGFAAPCFPSRAP
nr:hypothetical protein [Streptomyces albicerus]